ncbi:MAG TPA: hypothetical protein VLS49_05890 [Usitatibacter sp.]|nr:hypothetical protein [Usitatibacter sp.]
MRNAPWDERIEAARTEAEVIAVARDYVASLESFETAQLPRACAPPELRSSKDLTSYAFDLVLYESSPDDTSRPLLLDLAIFFSNASNRLARILGRSAMVEGEALDIHRR